MTVKSDTDRAPGECYTSPVKQWNSIFSGFLLLLVGIGGCADRTPPGQAQRGTVTVTLDQFGVGSRYRPGAMTGIRVELLSGLDEAGTVFVQWEVPNVDGDIAEYGRTVALTPGMPQILWLYAPLSPRVSAESVWPVRVFMMNDGQRGREVGGALISPDATKRGAATRLAASSLLATIGAADVGLNDYSFPQMQQAIRPANENTYVVPGIRPNELPDRWEGLRAFDAVVWSTDVQPTPGLTIDPAQALHDYIERGGHFIIVLPPEGDPWGLAQPVNRPPILGSLLPTSAPTRHEDVPVEILQPILSKSRGVDIDRPVDFSVWVFDDVNERTSLLEGSPYEPLLTLPDGRAVVVQRRYGHGRITLVGIDVTSNQLRTVPLENGSAGMPQADVFWNQILGRRSDTPSASELYQIEQDNRLRRNVPREFDMGGGALIADPIAMSQRAGAGLFLALILFIIYWVLAGPGGFAVLKQYKMAHHSWISFAAAAAIFTALAWGSVTVLQQRRIEVKHLTFLDVIAKTPDQQNDLSIVNEPRAVSYFSVYFPGYGQTSLRIDSEPGRRDLLRSWTPPDVPIKTFSNADRYAVDLREPATFDIPKRSTASMFQADWLGPLDSNWQMIRPTTPIRVTMTGSNEDMITGVLTHNLPATLEDVTLIWVQNNRVATRTYGTENDQEGVWIPEGKSGHMSNLGHMWKLAGNFRWDAGIPVNLQITLESAQQGGRATRLERTIETKYVDPEANRGFASAQALVGSRQDYLEMLSFFQQLTPPTYLRNPRDTQDVPSVFLYRKLGWEHDLSEWFTRPCLIVMGTLRNSELPIPLEIDGDRPNSEGLTIVRWIYPLDLEEEIAFADILSDPDAESE